MKAKFSVIHLLMLVGLLTGCLLIGCSETDHDVFNDVAPPSLLPSYESNPSLPPAVSVDTVVQPLPLELPLEQEDVAAAPPLLLAVVPIVSCGAAVFEVGTLFFDTPKFLSNSAFFLSMACPVGGGSVKGIKILKKAKNLSKIDFKKFTLGNFRKNVEKLSGKPLSQAYEVHHVIPKKFEAEAAKLGVNVHQPWFGVPITTRYHKSFSYKYEKAWDEFFKQPNLTQSKLLNKAESMVNDYRLKSGSYLELIK